MAEKRTAKKATRGSGKGLTAEEKAALRETVRERKAAEQGANDEKAVLAKIAQMKEPDRAMAKRIHAIVKANGPMLTSRTWYGMPAYAKDDKVVLFFQDAHKFKSRYATLGFSDQANLDEGAMWPVGYALKELTARDEARIAALVKKAVS